MIKPLANNILVKLEKSKTNGLILMQDTNDDVQIVEVIQLGKKIDNIDIGSKIIINNYSGVKVNYKKVEYLIIKQDDVLAIID